MLDGSNGFTLSGGVSHEYVGYSVSGAGDVNGDGFDDVVVGAFGAYAPAARSGAGYVIFGRADGFIPDLALSSLDGSNGFRIGGVNEGDYAGVSVSGAGDINGDGFDDLLMAALFGEPGPIGGRSSVTYVVFGKSGGFGADLNVSSLDGTNGFRITDAGPSERAAQSVSGAGDVNGDGFDDIVIGASYASGSGFGSGVSYVVLGRSSMFSPSLSVSELDGANGFRIVAAASGDHFGYSVSGAGDLNSDGFDDIIIGAKSADGNVADSGAGYVIFGKAEGFAATIGVAALNGSDGFKISGEFANDQAGRSVSGTGDVNGDGFDDLFIGAPQSDGSADFSGAGYVVFGKAVGFTDNLNLSDLDGANGFKLSGIAFFDRTGASVSGGGDFNGDGFGDLLIGAPYADRSGVSSGPGAAFMIFGKANGFSANQDLTELDVSSGLKFSGLSGGHKTGNSVSSAGDVNGDGFAELHVGPKESSQSGFTFAGATYVIFGQPSGVITPAISVSQAFAVEGADDGTSTATFTVSLSSASAQTITVQYATGDDIAEAPGDYTALAPTTLTFNPGEVSKTVTVNVRGDGVFEPDETFFLNLSNPTNATLLAPQGKGTIINDDPVPGISIDDVRVTEGDAGDASMANFTVSLSNSSALPITVRYSAADGTAAAGRDYVALEPGTLTFNPGEVSKTVSVEMLGDALSETDETYFVNLSNPGNARIADGQGVGTILSDDPIPSISIDDITVNEGDSGSTMATFAISLSNAFEDIVTFQFATVDGTAVSPDDYEAIDMGMHLVALLPGSVSTSISVLLRGDTLSETSETFFLALSDPFNATISKAEGQATILDDDPLPTLSVGDISIVEGSGAIAATFTVSLSQQSSQPITVDFATADGTAMSPDDYSALASSKLTFAPGETEKTITVDVLGDAIFEPDETFFINLSNPANATLGDAQGQATIINDDPLPSLSIDDVMIVEGNGGTSATTFTVSLSGPSSVAVTVDYSSADGTALSADDYVGLGLGTLTFAPGETEKSITVDVVGDFSFESNESFFLNLSNPDQATLADPQGEGTILDNDVLITPIKKGGVTFTDADGDRVMVTVNRGVLSAENFTFDVDGNLLQIDLNAAANPSGFAGAKLTMAAEPNTGGDGRMSVGAIHASGLSLKSVKVGGDLGIIDVGEGLPGKSALKKLTAETLGLSMTPDAESTIAGTLGMLKVSGDVAGVLNVTGGLSDNSGASGNALVAIKKVMIGGDLDGRAGGEASGLLRVSGDIGSVVVKGSVIGGAKTSGIAAGGTVANIMIDGDLRSDDPDAPVTLSALGLLGVSKQNKAITLQRLRVGGNVFNAQILAGFGRDGTPLNADAGIGKIIVDGNWSASSAAAGVMDATADGYGLNDVLMDGGDAGIFARIASITINGTATGSAETGKHFGITAEQIGNVKLSKGRQPLNIGNADTIDLSPNFTLVDFT